MVDMSYDHKVNETDSYYLEDIKRVDREHGQIKWNGYKRLSSQKVEVCTLEITQIGRLQNDIVCSQTPL